MAPWNFFGLIVHLSRLLRTNRHTETPLDPLQPYIKATLDARIIFPRKPDGHFQPTVRYKEHNLQFAPLISQTSSLGEQFPKFLSNLKNFLQINAIAIATLY